MKSGKHEADSSPGRMYSKPAAILGDATLTNPEKREILLRLKDEAIHMQESTSEGFGGGVGSHLDEITAALDQLGD